MSLSTGRSRPLDEVGLAPKQYTEWNEVGRARSTGDLSQQGLLPEVRCTACTKGVFTKTTKYQKDPKLCALEAYIAGDTLCHQPMGAGHVTVPQLWAYGSPCPAMVLPNVGPRKEGKLLYPDHHLIRCTKSGFRPAHPHGKLDGLCTEEHYAHEPLPFQ